MKKIAVVLFILFVSVPVLAQVQIPADIKNLMQKVKSGQELTEAEEARMEKWQEDLDKQMDKLEI